MQANRSGKYNSNSRIIDWFVGRLEKGETINLQVKLQANQLGDYEHYLSVVSEEGAKAESQLQTRVDGVASLVLEIVDLEDPVEVGAETAYEVRVRNEGTKAANNVELGCDLPTGVSLIGAKGPTESMSENGQIVFKGLTSLAPGKTAIYRVHVKAQTSGSRKFRAYLKSDTIPKPLVFEELTKFYSE